MGPLNLPKAFITMKTTEIQENPETELNLLYVSCAWTLDLPKSEILFWFFCVKWQGMKIKVNTKTD